MRFHESHFTEIDREHLRASASDNSIRYAFVKVPIGKAPILVGFTNDPKLPYPMGSIRLRINTNPIDGTVTLES
jgi:hypothetical protein